MSWKGLLGIFITEILLRFSISSVCFGLGSISGEYESISQLCAVSVLYEGKAESRTNDRGRREAL